MCVSDKKKVGLPKLADENTHDPVQAIWQDE